MLIIACGALAHEITALRRANGWDQLDVRCLPTELHNAGKDSRRRSCPIHSSRDRYRAIFVAYATVTGGLLDDVSARGGR